MPLRVVKIWFVDEPASMFFSLLTMLTHLVLGWRYYKWTKHMKQKYGKVSPYRGMWLANYVIWTVTFFCSTIFHVHDIFVTERGDYFCAMLSVEFLALASLITALGLETRLSVYLICVPFVWFYVYYLHSMSFVLFDYGWHVQWAVAFVLTGVVTWVSWAAFSREGRWSVVLPLVTGILGFGVLELIDFETLWGLFDAHSLWHASNPYLAWCASRMVVYDTRLKFARKKLHNSGRRQPEDRVGV